MKSKCSNDQNEPPREAALTEDLDLKKSDQIQLEEAQLELIEKTARKAARKATKKQKKKSASSYSSDSSTSSSPITPKANRKRSSKQKDLKIKDKIYAVNSETFNTMRSHLTSLERRHPRYSSAAKECLTLGASKPHLVDDIAFTLGFAIEQRLQRGWSDEMAAVVVASKMLNWDNKIPKRDFKKNQKGDSNRSNNQKTDSNK